MANNNITEYKGFEIEYDFYGEGEYSVQYDGDDLMFDSVEEAEHFIDEVTKTQDTVMVFTVSEHKNDGSVYTISTDNEEWNSSQYARMNFDNIYFADLFGNMQYITNKCKDKFGCTGCFFETGDPV